MGHCNDGLVDVEHISQGTDPQIVSACFPDGWVAVHFRCGSRALGSEVRSENRLLRTGLSDILTSARSRLKSSIEEGCKDF